MNENEFETRKFINPDGLKCFNEVKKKRWGIMGKLFSLKIKR